MYFKGNKSDTNIDDEFENDNILSKIVNMLNKYKWGIIALIIIILIILMILLFMNKKVINYLVLSGDEEITLYQGMDYVEPGYEAYNSKNEDLTKNVVISYDVDTDKIGEYEITYTIGEIIKIRKITVLEKPETYTSIYLKPVDNSINIYLKVGENYEEPGYQVFSSTDEDLTDEVEVIGEVDTSKKGNYKLIYSVTDQNGVTITATRLVIVMDTEVSLSLSTDSYTNKDVVINIGIIDNYFDYIIIPDGSKIKDNTYSYKVTENGKYVFKIYNIKGDYKEESIEVKNIDKISPTGSCSGTYKDGVSSVNIFAKDNVKIDRYVINNKSYTNSKITIDSEIKNVNVTIYDLAGNSKNISCNLENKNGSSSMSSSSSSNNSVKNEPIYQQEKYHDNSINGIRYILFSQTDSRWKDVSFGNDDTLGDIGCAVTSVAVVVSAYDNTINPEKVSNIYRYNWPYYSINNLADEGFDCEHDRSVNIKEALSLGKIVVIQVNGRNANGSSKFTSGHHYMALIDYDSENDKIFVGNSYSNSTYGKSGWFKASEVLTSVTDRHVCTPTQFLLDKFK